MLSSFFKDVLTLCIFSQMLLKMRTNDTKVPDINLHKSSKRKSRFDNSNSQKRKNNDQTKLMKIKNFPPDFFENANFNQNEDIRKKDKYDIEI